MAGDLAPETVLQHLREGRMRPYYLFYGPGEFLLERVLADVREDLIAEDARELNRQIFYADEEKVDPGAVIEAAQSLPFLSVKRLIIVRRTEAFSAEALKLFIPYLENPAESTCLIFVSAKTNFSWKFYAVIRKLGGAVNFPRFNQQQVIPWIKRMAKEIGLRIDTQACAYLPQIAGNRLRDIYSELEKLLLRYGDGPVGVEQVKETAVFSRSYTVFELMDAVSFRRRPEAVSVLRRYLQEEGRDSALGVLGMLNRQIRLLWQTKTVAAAGGNAAEVARKVKLPVGICRKMIKQSGAWTVPQLEKAVQLLYEADGLIKSSSPGPLVLENLILRLCG